MKRLSRETEPFDDLLKVVSHVAVVERSASWRSENVSRVVPAGAAVEPLRKLARPVFPERLDENARQRNGAAGTLGLGLDKREPAFNPLKCVLHGHRSAVQVDVWPAKSEKFTLS